MSSIGATRPPRVLLVDRDSTDLVFASKILKNAGYRVSEALGIKEAASNLKQHRFKAIVMALSKKDPNLLVLLKNIRQHKQLSQIPIVIFYNDDTEDDKRVCEKMGVTKFLHKPIQPKELKNKIDALFGDQKQLNLSIDIEQDKLIELLREKLESEELELPSKPKLLDKIIALINDDSKALSDVAELLEKEPAICTKIIRVANSAFFASSKPALNLQDAVMRIGMDRTLQYVLVANNAQLFGVNQTPFSTAYDEVWKHSLITAACAKFIGEQVGYAETSNLFAFGLLHDVGKFTLLHLMQDLTTKDKPFRLEVIHPVLTKMHTRIGGQLMDGWEFPEEFVEIVKFHHDKPLKDKHGKHLIITGFANMLAHGIENKLTESERNTLKRAPQFALLRLKPELLREAKKAVEQEMEMMQEFM
jgi:putative nucleotidyltransferase with HDIG domain